MSKKNKNNNEEVVEVNLNNIVVETDPETEPVIEPVVEVVPEPVPKEEPIYVINGCKKLNIRKEPSISAEVVCVIDEKAEIVIIEDNYGDWVEVLVDDKHGYCMKKFIVLK